MVCIGKIFTYAETYLPKIGYSKRIHLMNPMVPGLAGGKMSSSDPNSKIGLLDSSAEVERKIKTAFCEPGNIENNGVLSFIKMVLFPLCETQVHIKSTAQTGILRQLANDTCVVRVNGADISCALADCTLSGGYRIDKPAKWGGGYDSYYTYQQLELAFAENKIHPSDLKSSVTVKVNKLLDPIRQEFKDEQLQELIKQAYPATSANAVRQGDVTADDESKSHNIPTANGTTTQLTATQHTGKGATVNKSADVSRLDIRVGRIADVKVHPNADTLYVESIDVGLPERVQVVSGLIKYYTLEQLHNRLVLVLLNIKPTSMRGKASNAMVLAASNEDGSIAELLEPPPATKVGEHVTFSNFAPYTDAAVLPRANEKVLKAVFDELRTNDQLQATYQLTSTFMTSVGPVTVQTLANCKIK